MAKIDFSTYVDVLRVREAWRFDIGTILIRMYCYMFTIGTVSMVTLSGYSAFTAGTIAATLSVASFLFAPRIAQQIDLHGQQFIVPIAASISLVGLLGLITSITLQAPLGISYACAVLMGASPSAQAIARTRWSYLIHTGKYGAGSIDIRTVYSYEGVLEDAAFALAPAINIALSAAVHPAAGMMFGAVCLSVGTIVLLTATKTLPEVGWVPDDAGTGAAGAGDAAGGSAGANEGASANQSSDQRFYAADSPWRLHPERIVLRLSGTVRVLFLCMLCLGMMFGAYDSTVVVFCQSIGMATLASPVMMMSGLISVVSSFVFGSLQLKGSIVRILRVTSLIIGFGYLTTAFIFDPLSLFVFTIIASPCYGPFFITQNTVCEHAVPSTRLTEGITWINAGVTLGFVFGPSIAGLLNDTFGPSVGFIFGGMAAIAIPIIVTFGMRVLQRETK